mmetsp:Transcript_5386/g.8005  ORF Transcript_5386/g.8005 Transcript_5386/m.8005 type:complete len:86 (-) Transcript_5386:59-316(-)
MTLKRRGRHNRAQTYKSLLGKTSAASRMLSSSGNASSKMTEPRRIVRNSHRKATGISSTSGRIKSMSKPRSKGRNSRKAQIASSL